MFTRITFISIAVHTVTGWTEAQKSCGDVSLKLDDFWKVWDNRKLIHQFHGKGEADHLKLSVARVPGLALAGDDVRHWSLMMHTNDDVLYGSVHLACAPSDSDETLIPPSKSPLEFWMHEHHYADSQVPISCWRCPVVPWLQMRILLLPILVFDGLDRPTVDCDGCDGHEDCHDEETVRKVNRTVLFLGLGPGGVPAAVDAFHSDWTQTAVDSSAQVREYAVEWLGLDDSKIEIHIDDAIHFVQQQAKQEHLYDVIVLDLWSDAGDSLPNAVLDTVLSALAPQGILAFNILTENASARKAELLAHDMTVLELDLPPVNTGFIAYRTKPWNHALSNETFRESCLRGVLLAQYPPYLEGDMETLCHQIVTIDGMGGMSGDNTELL